MEFVQLYHERAKTSITIATRRNSSFYIDTTRPLPPSVGFGELSLPPMLSLYKLQQSLELSLKKSLEKTKFSRLSLVKTLGLKRPFPISQIQLGLLWVLEF